MLKIASVVGLANENTERGGQKIQVENQDEKKPTQKSRKSQQMAKSKKWIRAKKAEVSRAKNLSQSDTFFTIDAKRAFTILRQAFVEALILNHFDPERYIIIEMDALGYGISEIFSQLTSNNLGQWHPIAFFSKKMIPAETRYETNNGKLLAIIEAFKIWGHYLEGCKHKVLVLTDYNNLQRFMDIKSLSFRQIR